MGVGPESSRAESPAYPFRESWVVLRDGRRLSCAEFGDPGGSVVLWFHGSPGSRTQVPPGLDRVARSRGIRVIGVDRPGMGGSTRDPAMTFLSFAEDVRQLVDVFQVSRFGVIGLSGGGAFGLACACALPDRVSALVTLGSPAPLVGPDAAPGYSRTTVRLAVGLYPVKTPLGWLATLAIKPLRPLAHPALWVVQKVWWPVDRPIFQQPGFARMFAESFLVASEHGLHGLPHDYALFGRPWGFRLEEIRVPVSVWHGDRDPFVPLAHARYLNEKIPRSELVVLRGGGHLAAVVRVEEVLETVIRLGGQE